MHHMILVTVTEGDNLDTSEKVRRYVAEYLAEEGFADGGESAERRFVVQQVGYGDSFCIGGRWSGLLTDHKYDLWELYGPPGGAKPNELITESLAPRVFLGHEDDAQVVTKELYDRFLKQWEERAEGVVPGREDIEDGFFVREHDDGHGYDGFLDIEDEPVDVDFIRRKWLVVVDLHE
jgi:hypothetical protein